jgi:PQQ-like domain
MRASSKLLRLAPPALAVAVWAAACGGGGSAPAATTGSVTSPRIQPPAHVSAGAGGDWPLFGFDPQRSGDSRAATGITAANVRRLGRQRVTLPGIADSSPVYLNGVPVRGANRDVFFVTTTYGKTVAVDAHSGAILWAFVPSGIGSWEGSPQVTTASPAADPDRRFIYATSPDGRVHKLAVADGHEAPGWPVTITRDPRREKLGTALNIAGASVVATTGGYYGDAPVYQGHVVAIDRASGHIANVFNALCANLHHILVPSSCGSSDAAIWARAGAVVERSGRLLVATGNGPYDGRTNFGDSVVELTSSLRPRQAFTPPNQRQLSASDTDLGSSAPALLPGNLVAQGSKDRTIRLLDLRRLGGRAPGGGFGTGGALQSVPTPGGAELFSQPAVWRHGSSTTVFVATAGGTTAYQLRGRRLSRGWSNGTPGSSPVIAGGLLWIYDINGGLNVYSPGNGKRLATLPCGGGHWNSPIIAGGVVAEPEGGSNADSATSGILNLYSVGR